MKKDNSLASLLSSHYFFHPLIEGINDLETFHLDLGPSNSDIDGLDLTDNKVFNSYLERLRLEYNFDIAVGGYNEERILYSRSNHFGSGDEARNIHLGVDLWKEEGTPIHAPLDGVIHSYANNTNYRDYGPTIILEHKLSGIIFYTLYGHLSASSLENKKAGQEIVAGEIFAEFGKEHENGNWPPHVHFQLITEIGNYKGDYPGVATKKDREKYLQLCPDPNLILRLGVLKG